MTAAQIPLTLRAPSGCACCAPDAVSSSPAAAAGPSSEAEYALLGLTCGGCASRVAALLKELDGVIDAAVTPVPGGISTATVTSSRPLERTAVAGAVERAGYRLADSPVDRAARSCCS